MTRFRRVVGKALATLGVAGLAVAGAAGVALADDNDAAAWPGAGDQGTIQIQKKDTDQNNLEGVVFSATLLGVQDGENCVALDLTTQDGWKTADTAIKKYNTFFQNSDPKPGAPGGPTAAAALAAAGLCEFGTAETLGATGTDGLTAAKTVDKGLYLIQETSAGANVITKAAAPFIVAVPYPEFGEDGTVTWKYDVLANAKNELTTPEIPDKVVDGENVGGAWEPGAVQEWTITATVPEATTDYESIAITDIPGGLTFEGFVSIEMGDEELGYTLSDDGFTATLDADSLAEVNKAAKNGPVVLTVVVKTSVPENYAGGALNNKATLNLNGKPGEPGGTDVTVWGALKIEKVDQKGNPLTGAEFSVYPAEANGTCAATAPDDAITGVKAEELKTLWIYNGLVSEAEYSKVYCVLETKAPAGYVIDETPKPVTVTFDGTVVVTTETVVNVPTEGPELPTTGASGTLLMTVGGLGLIALAGGVYMVTRRKVTN